MPAGVETSPELVRTDAGPVRGALHEEHRLFQGIPYAAPPVGALRWRAPRPASPWTEPRDATRPGSPCPQTPTEYSPLGSDDEDCLYLEVITPRSVDEERLRPVMVMRGTRRTCNRLRRGTAGSAASISRPRTSSTSGRRDELPADRGAARQPGYWAALTCGSMPRTARKASSVACVFCVVTI
ncbi:carboxylesterase family protein [Sorangium sp. So ce1078]|uniref:carboxylesterase family protein n=1 Tax=Sorangium sp. So ce1078 TaxID=3133329 RepID=UPI003F62FA72